ncbi:MAG TPA: hypothetical protein VIL20_20715, partial [Sandaracinaceae bacterium]
MDTVVYFGTRLPELGLDRLEGGRTTEGGTVEYVARGVAGLRLRRRVVGASDFSRAIELLTREPVDALVVDARGGREAAERLLDALFPPGKMGAPLSRKRVLALVDAGATEDAFAFGARGIGGVVAAPSAAELAARLDAMLADRGHGKVAICLAGG